MLLKLVLKLVWIHRPAVKTVSRPIRVPYNKIRVKSILSDRYRRRCGLNYRADDGIKLVSLISFGCNEIGLV